jgi:hypothetical protein
MRVAVKSRFALQKVMSTEFIGPTTGLGGLKQPEKLRQPPLLKCSSADRVRPTHVEVGRSQADDRGRCRELCGPPQASRCM